jgi:hypothetical protein
MPKQSSWLLKNLMDPSAEKAESLMRSRSADLHQGQGRTKPHNEAGYMAALESVLEKVSRCAGVRVHIGVQVKVSRSLRSISTSCYSGKTFIDA